MRRVRLCIQNRALNQEEFSLMAHHLGPRTGNPTMCLCGRHGVNTVKYKCYISCCLSSVMFKAHFSKLLVFNKAFRHHHLWI